MRSTVVAYILLLLFGIFGGHKFYLGNIKGGILYIFLFIAGAIGAFLGIGLVLFAVLLVLLLIDFFTLPKQVAKANGT